jgi:hypothetical protein
MQQIRTELQRIWPAALIVAIAVAGVIMLLQHLSLDQRITEQSPAGSPVARVAKRGASRKRRTGA